MKIGLKFVAEYPIALNGTILMVGEVLEILFEDDSFSQSQIIQLDQTKAVGVNGLETYYSVQKIEELPYAKPDNKQ